MRFVKARAARLALSMAVGTALGCAVFGATATSAFAWGDGDRDSYTVNISPATAQAGTSTTFDVALKNTSSPGSGLNSALLAPPFGFRVTGATLNGVPQHVFFNVVLLDHLNVPSGSTIHVMVTAKAPSSCSSPYSRWFTFANEGGWWSEDLRLDTTNSSATTNVTCVVATGVKFVNQPADTLVGSQITNSPYSTSGSPVTVQLVDASGNPVNTSGVPVTIALGNNPGNATLGGTTTENTVNGVATFSDLTLNQPDNGYTLTATGSGLSNTDTSNSFNENNNVTSCPTGSTCTNTITSGSGSLKVDVGSGGSDTTLTESVDVGTPMDGPGSSATNDPGCASYTPPAASADWYEFVVGASDRSKTVTWTVNGTTTDSFTQVCFGAPYEFSAQGTDSGLAPAGTLPDGSRGFVGLLDPCSELVPLTSPCIQSLTTITNTDTGGQSTTAVVTIPAGNVGDPMIGR